MIAKASVDSKACERLALYDAMKSAYASRL